ncbi:MAG: response regulator [Deltaproteobacteria bacterium]|jgi:CheY-like chemotaxis protein/tRNA A-37 threonylcarbamoyl transferase component Bud32|nr:response regulator [Deltaproteobacteria bacterium]MBW2537881.1 response regulator [Deltaproteobacteria bacterium]
MIDRRGSAGRGEDERMDGDERDGSTEPGDGASATRDVTPTKRDGPSTRMITGVRLARDLRPLLRRLTAVADRLAPNVSPVMAPELQGLLNETWAQVAPLAGVIDRLEKALPTPTEPRIGFTDEDPWRRVTHPPTSAERSEEVKGSLLVVDDSELNRLIVTQELTSRGFAVKGASDGMQALELVRTRSFDLILLDVMMPGISGLDVLREIRKHRSPADLPVIMVTGRDASEDIVEALRAGANDYVTKPLDIGVGMARIETQLTLRRAKEELEELNAKLIEAQEQISDLASGAGANTEDVAGWASSVAAQVASAIDAALIEVNVFEDGQPSGLEEIANEELRRDLERVVQKTKALLRARHGVVPVLGRTGKLFGALLVSGKDGGWSKTDRHLLDSLANQLGGALELRQMRDKLADVAEQRRVRQQELLDKGIDLLRICPACGRCYDQNAEQCEDDLAELSQPRSFPYRVADRYRLEKICGEGGMGTVYRAYDERLTRPVALKVIRAELFNNDTVRQRFEQEARTVARIDHPGVVAVYDSGELDDGSLFLVMEWLDGCDLSMLIKERGRGTPTEIATLLRQAGAALGAAAEIGLVHRDIKPANIFLVPEGQSFRVKLLDFGIAKEISTDVAITQTGSLLGTPRYMSPEQLLQRKVDGRSDLYSLAAVVYEALTGVGVVQADDFAEVVLAVVQTDPPSPSAHAPSLSDEVDSLFRVALAKEPDARPDHVKAWSADLAAELERAESDVPGWSVDGVCDLRVAQRIHPAASRETEPAADAPADAPAEGAEH